MSKAQRTSMLLMCAFILVSTDVFAWPDIKISKDGRVQVGGVKADTVPPEARVIERIVKGEPAGKAIENEIKSRVEDAKTIPNTPLVLNAIENGAFEEIRGVIGDDAVDVVETVNLPNQIGRAVPAAVASLLDKPAGADDFIEKVLGVPLQSALLQARDYYSNKAGPIPKSVKLLLMKTFPPSILNNARFVVDDFGGNTPAIINKIKESYGEDYAVTVDNIIVFSTTPDDKDVFFWAHEMQHTVQYSKFGIDGFAAKYTTNYAELEQEANVVAAKAEIDAQEVIDVMAAIGN